MGPAQHSGAGPARGRLFGVGVGPGDPELITVKARLAVERCPVIAYPVARHGQSVARSAAAPYIGAGQTELALTYPVTTEDTDHPDGYEGALRDYYDEAAAAIAEHLDCGRDVAVLCEGDPFFYGSYMYIHERLAPRFETEVIPGVTGFSAAAASAGTPLAKRDDILTVLPGTLPPATLAAHLRATDAAVVMKLGRTFEDVRAAAIAASVDDQALYAERASSPNERVQPLASVEGPVPYMSLVLVPTRTRAHSGARTSDPGTGANGHSRHGHVSIVGLGPAGPEWLTPEAATELAAADDVVGYDTYLARVPVRPGQRRHPSPNRVEADRARHALELAAAGSRVAVVSSGDPGIFAMAAAVLEQLEDGEGRPTAYADLDIRVVPGLSAMQAAAARAGAPLGHDFCVISLSDILKPAAVVERRLHAAGEADLVVALYNPASKTRREGLARAIEILAGHRDPDTPVVVARAVGSPEETVTITPLATLDLDSVDMRTLLIVGSSTTRTLPGDPPRVYTPRRYPE